MKVLSFYFRYAFRSFVRGRSRSVFGAFCIAAGVAAVVALGLVGTNYQNSVSSDGQKINRGDLSVAPGGQGFRPQQYAYFAELKRHGQIVDYTTRLQTGAQFRKLGNNRTNLIGMITGVDPGKFPFYDTISGDTPAGTPLARLLASPRDAVVGHSVFDKLHLRIGDRLSVDTENGNGAITYTVTGVVPNSAPDPIPKPFPNDFIMVNSTSIVRQFTAQGVAAGTVYVKTASTAQALTVKRAIEHRFGVFAVTTTTAAQALKNAQAAPKDFDTFFQLMGVVAVVIGGIGIINTMLVAARRRTKEIGVLKAVGMKGRQVVLALTLEALILALAGTAVGIALGIGASVEVTQATGSITGASIAWSLSPGAVISGALIGIVATVFFAYLPIVRASRSRPVAALRGDNAKLPGLGRWRSTLLVLSLAGVAGYLTILYTGLFSGVQAVAIGAVAGVGALVIAGLLTQVFVLAVWLISKLPAMGRLSLRMAFRNMGTQKRRLGSTLLALFIGMMALSVVSIISQSLKVSAQTYVQRFNTNVFVQTKQDAARVENLNRELSQLPGIRHRETGAVDQAARLTSVDGVDVTTLLQRDLAAHRFTLGALANAADQAAQGIEGHDPRIFSDYFTISRGRNLAIRDIGTNHVVVGAKLAKPLGIVPGSRLVMSEGTRHIRFVVVGVISDKTLFVTDGVFADLRYLQREGLTAPNPNHFTFTSLDIDGTHLKPDIATLQRRLPSASVVDVSDYTTQITGVVDSLALLPQIIAVLCLIAGAVIIANTVALGMIERRSEFGVMKAVGARRRTILQFLAVEHAIIGFVGAAAGVGLAILGASVIDTNLLYLTTSLNPASLGGLILLGIGLALGASALTAFPASGEKPLAVLRYE